MNYNVERILFLGATGVGKTQLARRLILDDFKDTYQKTIGTNLDIYNLSSDKETYLFAHDVAGDTRYQLEYKNDLRICNQVVLVFDRNNPASLNELQNYYDFVKKNKPNCRIILVETCIYKENLSQSINDEAIEAFKTKNNLITSYFEVSAKKDEGIDDLRKHILKYAVHVKSSKNPHIQKLIEWVDINEENYLDTNKLTINEIIIILNKCELITDTNERKRYYLKKELYLTLCLEQLQKTSNFKTLQNVISTILACVACLALVGFLPLYLNKKNNGDAFLFWTKGDKQQAELAINLVKKNLPNPK